MSKVWNIIAAVVLVAVNLVPLLTVRAAEPATPTTPAVSTTRVVAAVVSASSSAVAHSLGESLKTGVRLAAATPTSYTFAAEHGDGITHLARKAVAQYLHDTEQSDTFSRAERVYLEDYLQNKIGTFGLALNQAETFTVETITAAVTALGKVDPQAIARNVAQFAERVNWDKYEKLQFAGALGNVAQAAPDDQSNDGSSVTDNPSDSSGDQQGAIDSSSTENDSASSRRRVTSYIILIVIILAVAGYFLLREEPGTEGKPTGEKKLRKFSAENFLKFGRKEEPKETKTEEKKPEEKKDQNNTAK